MKELIGSLNVNFFLIPLIALSIILLKTYYDKIKRINKFINFKDDGSVQSKRKRRSVLASTKEKLYIILMIRNKGHMCNAIFNAILILIFAAFIFALSLKSLILAIGIPLITFIFINKILDEMVVGFEAVVRRNFTNLINQIIKVFSVTSDLGVVLYESSKDIDEPLRTLILTLSREVMIDNNDQQLIKFIERTDNLWLHSFILTLLSYKENSSKEQVIENLLKLSDMIEDRNEISDKMINDRKPVVIMNYMVMAVSMLVFIANLVLNPMILPFLSTPTGIFCLLGGLSATLGTVLINMKLVKY